MKNIIVITLLLCTFSLFAQQKEEPVVLVSPRIVPQQMSVGGSSADVAGFNNQSIQFAIDEVTKTGGTVKLNAGTYEITAPVRMKSNVNLIGAGKETILKKSKGVQTHFVVDADYGELKLTVENADGFEPGMKIQVTDDENSSCWNVSTAYVTDVQDNMIYIDDYLIRDYRADKNGLVSNASSVIEVIKAENCTITNLTIDGNRADNFFADGCNSAGILIFKSKKITVNNVHVKDFNGEGISWQITENVTIENSEIANSGNNGLHPGTGSPFTVIENNNIHNNDLDGLYICWRVYQSRVTNNQFHGNGRFGICTGHKDTDVTFRGNHVFNNGSDGINLRGEREANAPHRNTFIENTIENNGVKGSGYGFSVNAKAHDLLLKNNVFKSTGQKTQKTAIYIYTGGLPPKLENNTFNGQPLDKVVFEKK